MRLAHLGFITIFSCLSFAQAIQNNTCKKCHPTIYREYQTSIHAHSTLATDPIHQAVWQRHPAKKSGNYNCKGCHTNDPFTSKAPEKSDAISCQKCHTIEHIENRKKTNKNIYINKGKYFYAADKARKGDVVSFHETSTFGGLFTHTIGSPFHKIDYGNDLYYNGKVCLGCHDHKQNALGFTICDLEVKPSANQEHTCISCHMPQVKGTLANQLHTPTHAFHGTSIHTADISMLAKHVDIDLVSQTPTGFALAIHNKATHTLFPHPLRLSQLRISIEHGTKKTTLPPVTFRRLIGTKGEPSAPWLATEVIEDTTIKAGEKRTLSFDSPLQKGDTIIVTLGYYLVAPQNAKTLNLEKRDASRWHPLLHKRFHIDVLR